MSMARQLTETIERNRLVHRIRYLYHFLNENNWEACFERLDPKLREESIDFKTYAASLSSFFKEYGPIRLESVEELRLFLRAKGNKHDDRPFAYGLVIWKDRKKRQHVLRERWVRSEDTWYTRMVGLV